MKNSVFVNKKNKNIRKSQNIFIWLLAIILLVASCEIYRINGRLSTNESDFSGFSGLKVNISGNPALFSAQVQISSVSGSAILAAAEDIVEMIFNFSLMKMA